MKQKPKGLPGYITQDLYDKYSDIFDKAWMLDQLYPIDREPVLIMGREAFEALEKVFKEDKDGK